MRPVRSMKSARAWESAWSVMFGDGKRKTGKGRPPKTIQHTYAKPGRYPVTLAVTVRRPTV